MDWMSYLAALQQPGNMWANLGQAGAQGVGNLLGYGQPGPTQQAMMPGIGQAVAGMPGNLNMYTQGMGLQPPAQPSGWAQGLGALGGLLPSITPGPAISPAMPAPQMGPTQRRQPLSVPSLQAAGGGGGGQMGSQLLGGLLKGISSLMPQHGAAAAQSVGAMTPALAGAGAAGAGALGGATGAAAGAEAADLALTGGASVAGAAGAEGVGSGLAGLLALL